MTPQEFEKEWTKDGEMTSPIHPELIIGLGLKQSTIEFLTHAGLPVEAAPFLSFAKDTDDFYEGVCRLIQQYDFLAPEFGKFISIGYDGGGNPIVINTEANDQIEWLDHENNFSSRFMNSSLEKLAEYLILYRGFIHSILEEHGEDAYSDGKFTDEQFDKLKEKMMQADSKALAEGFWKEEFEMLVANRAENLDKDKNTVQ